jgi:hypothetical protein
VPASFSTRSFANLFLPRELQLRQGLIELRLRLLDLFALAIDLSLDGADIGSCDGKLCLRLIGRDPVVAIVDPRQQIAGIDVLIVGGRHIGGIAANLRRDRKTPGRDEGVVGGFVMTDVESISDAPD